MNFDKELIETVLKNHGHAHTVQRVISMESESALPKGENYLSTIYRISLKVVLGNGRLAKKSLILKVVPPEKAKTELVKDMGVFKTETLMYSNVLREMEMLMEEFGDTNDPLWCKLVHYEPYNALVLEDLRSSGFRMTRRQDCLDLEHALLVLRSLGRFHAMSKILETRGIISKDDFKPYSLVSDKNLIKYFMYYGLQTLAKAMEDHWGPEWYDVAQKLKIPCEVLEEKMMELGKVDETRFNCLNHGDCWSNNMMFKYDWKNHPTTMRFIDFQIVHYNSPAWDVMATIYNSTKSSLRRAEFSTLLSTYHSALSETLSVFHYEGEIPTLEYFEKELDRLEFEGYLEVIYKFITIAENPNGFDLDTIMKTDGQKGYDIEIFANDYAKKMTEDDVMVLANVHLPSIYKTP